jgi:hypothetical protein
VTETENRLHEMEERYPEVAGPWLCFVDGEATELRSVHDEWIITEPTDQSVRREHMIGWVCHYCHVEISGAFPREWELVWQSPVCPGCWKRVPGDGGIAVVKGGAYADGRPDPREKP